jgi:hypothetical protein
MLRGKTRTLACMATASPYGTRAKDYLARAEQRLAEHAPEGLFYAALELRCGIERRMKQYLDAQTHISKARKSGWEIAKLAKGIEEAFRTGDQIVEFTVMAGPGGEVLARFLYTPVTGRLQKLGQQLGNYLHATAGLSEPSEAWWSEFRSKLDEAVHLLRMATTGELLGAPLLHKTTHQIRMSGEFDQHDERLKFMQGVFESKSKIHVQVAYHKERKLEPVPPRHAS